MSSSTASPTAVQATAMHPSGTAPKASAATADDHRRRWELREARAEHPGGLAAGAAGGADRSRGRSRCPPTASRTADPSEGDHQVAQPPTDAPDRPGENRVGAARRLLGAQPEHRGNAVGGGDQPAEQHQRGQVRVDDRGLAADPRELLGEPAAGAERAGRCPSPRRRRPRTRPRTRPPSPRAPATAAAMRARTGRAAPRTRRDGPAGRETGPPRDRAWRRARTRAMRPLRTARAAAPAPTSAPRRRAAGSPSSRAAAPR